MKLSAIREYLATAEAVNFQLPDGTFVPEHFHVTEVGMVSKNFIDCGGTVRNEKVANFQLWNANDTEHRLKPAKLLNIITLAEKVIGMEDAEIEVEYQGTDTIGKYGLEFENGNFILTSKQTDCLAKDNCGVPKQKLQLINLGTTGQSCSPDKGCC